MIDRGRQKRKLEEVNERHRNGKIRRLTMKTEPDQVSGRSSVIFNEKLLLGNVKSSSIDFATKFKRKTFLNMFKFRLS